MAKYVYPAVFIPETDGSFSVEFRDLEGCYTGGANLEEAMEMAKDVLELVLYGYEIDKREIPEPSPIASIRTENGEFVSYISADTIEYRRMNNGKTIQTTLTIPEWLNNEALAEGINFSAVLQEALQERLMYR